jgi:hypothetical protein
LLGGRTEKYRLRHDLPLRVYNWAHSGVVVEITWETAVELTTIDRAVTINQDDSRLPRPGKLPNGSSIASPECSDADACICRMA